MNLQELKDTSSVELNRLKAISDSFDGDPFALIGQIVAMVENAVMIIPRSSMFADTPPPGNPDAVEAIAARYRMRGAAVRTLSHRMGRVATSTVPDAVVGLAGTKASDVAELIPPLLSSEAIGLETGAQAFRNYGSALGDAISTHRPGARTIREGHQAVRSISVNALKLLNPLTAVDEVTRILVLLRAALEQIVRGVGTCHDSYCEAWTAGLDLRRDLSDARGYARLEGVRVPEGMNSLDLLALRLAGGTVDPDNAVFSEKEWQNFEKNWNSLSEDERRQLTAALESEDSPLARSLILNALGSGATIAAVLGLATLLAKMNERQLKQIAGLGVQGGSADGVPTDIGGGQVSPNSWSDGGFNQYNNKTCGSTTLLALAAQTDPFLALYLMTGELPAGHVPRYLEGMDLSGTEQMSPADRMAHVQQLVQNRTNQLGGDDSALRYPNDWGSWPYGLRDEANRTGTNYDVEWVELGGMSSPSEEALARAAEAANNGTPVPLLVGSNPGGGGSTYGLAPDHYVVITGYHDGNYSIYEPASGEVYTVPHDIMVNGDPDGTKGFGYWHQIFAVLPPSE